MKAIRNKTASPLRVPLPQGKVLHLGPHKTGEIAVNAVEHPPFVKLVEAGKVEVLPDGEHAGPGHPAPSGPVHTATHGHAPDVMAHHRGER